MRLTKETTYLFTKRGVYYFSRRVPADLRTHYNRDRIVISLTTKSRLAAQTRAKSLALKLEEDWLTLRLKSSTNPFSDFLRDGAVAVAEPTGASLLSEALEVYIETKGRDRSSTFEQTANRSIGYTYQAEGTLMLTYLRKIGIDVTHDTLNHLEQEMKQKCGELFTLETIPRLSSVKPSDSKPGGYGDKTSEAKKVSSALDTLRRHQLPNDLDLTKLLITCKKKHWYRDGKGPKEADTPRTGPFSKGSSLFKGTSWIAKTTRGTNDYRHCTHLVYLYDQIPLPCSLS